MPSHKDDIYYCEICGAEVIVKNGGDGTLYCCSRKMRRRD